MHTLNDLEYESFGQVLTEVRDVGLFDLARYTVRLPKRYREILLPEPQGIYMRGVLDPVVVFGAKSAYFTKKQYEHAPKFPDILSFDNFIQSRQPVVDKKGKLIHVCPVMAQDLFSAECSFPYGAVYLAATAVWEALGRLHRHTRPTTSMAIKQLRPEQYVTEGALEHIDYEDQPGIANLLDKVFEFIGRDLMSVYHLRLHNTTLILEKGNDYRVIEYYRERFQQCEEAKLAADWHSEA